MKTKNIPQWIIGLTLTVLALPLLAVAISHPDTTKEKRPKPRVASVSSVRVFLHERKYLHENNQTKTYRYDNGNLVA